MKEKAKNLFSFFLRFGLSFILLGWLFTKIDFKHMWEAVKDADLNYIILGFGVFVLTNFIIFWRWVIIIKALDLPAHPFNAMRWFFVALFFNLFLPTSVGGDVVRGIGLGKEVNSKGKVFASIVLDRLAGFTGIVFIASAAFWGGRNIVQDSSIMSSIFIMAGVSITIFIVLFSRRVFKWATHVFSGWPPVKNALVNVHHDLLLMKGKQKEAFYSILLSALAQFVLAFEFYLVAKAMHQDIHLIYFVIFSPLVCVATSLPSIGGLGVREVGWVYLLSKVGVPEGVALGLSLLNFGFMVLVGLMGGLFYVLTLSSRRVQHHKKSAPLRPRRA